MLERFINARRRPEEFPWVEHTYDLASKLVRDYWQIADENSNAYMAGPIRMGMQSVRVHTDLYADLSVATHSSQPVLIEICSDIQQPRMVTYWRFLGNRVEKQRLGEGRWYRANADDIRGLVVTLDGAREKLLMERENKFGQRISEKVVEMVGDLEIGDAIVGETDRRESIKLEVAELNFEVSGRPSVIVTMTAASGEFWVWDTRIPNNIRKCQGGDVQTWSINPDELADFENVFAEAENWRLIEN